MEKYTVVCMKWGTKYSPDYVNRLYNMVVRNTSLPFSFICFTDNAEGINPQIEIRPLPEMPLPPDKERGWRKLSLFKKDVGLEGRILFLDLDTVIVGNIDEFFTMEGDFIYVKRYWNKSKTQGVGLTSVYRFEAGKFSDLYDNFIEHIDEVKAKYRHEQAYVGGVLGAQGRLNFFPSEWMPSFKHGCILPFPLCFFKEPRLPKGAKMIVFHGNPTPQEAMEGKVTGFKKFFRHVIPPKWLAEHWR